MTPPNPPAAPNPRWRLGWIPGVTGAGSVSRDVKAAFDTMLNQLQIERDERGFRQARVGGEFTSLSAFLEGDLQGCTESCREVLTAIDAVADGSSARWERTGNSCTLTLLADGADIYCEYTAPSSCKLSLQDFRDTVARWQEFIRNENHAA